MAKDPAFLFYSSDFLNGVADLTMEERGQYITLLCLQHQKGVLSEKTIRLSLGSVSADVLSKFTKDENGCYYQERLKIEIEKRANFTESRRKNGENGGRPKKETYKKPNGYPNGKPKNNHIEDENENVIVDENIVENKPPENLLNGNQIIPTLCRLWYNHFSTYTKDEENDFKAAGTILSFMVRQHSITDIESEVSRQQITATFEQIAEAVSKEQFWVNKPLKSIANNIQEFYNKIKNPVQNGTSKNNPAGFSRAGVQAELKARLNARQQAGG